MQIKLIKKIFNVELNYQQIPERSVFRFLDVSTQPPFSIINEAPWIVSFKCPQCLNHSSILKYNPLIALRKPVQSNFLRLASCHSKFYTLEELCLFQSIFEGSKILSEGEKHYLLYDNKSKYPKTNSLNIAYSTCSNCGQEYLTSFKFDSPSNERKKTPDPVLCHIKDIVQIDLYFPAGNSIEDFVILKNKEI